MFVKRRLAVVLVAGLAMCLGLGAALDASPADNDIKVPKLEFREVKLDNGSVSYTHLDVYKRQDSA